MRPYQRHLGFEGGYEKSHVTPYMHCMVYHVPECIRRYGNLRKFSGQVLKNTTTMQRGRTFLAINGMPPWTSSEQKPGLTAYD
ncbi:hypothetical protein EMCRGX_G003349 [Ephydatia muelleri]